MTARLLPSPGAIAAAALVLAAPAALGWSIATSDGFDRSFGSALLLACAAAACLAIMLTGPVGCLIAVLAVQIVGFMPVLTSVGRVDFTLADVFYVGLLGWWATQWAVRRRRREHRHQVRFGERAVLLFLAYIGVTTVAVLLLEPDFFGTSAVSWMRLVQTASLAWLAASVIQTPRELRLVINTLAVAATASIGLAVGAALLSGENLSGRYGGMLGPNALGLVSGLLILLVVVDGSGRKLSQRATLGVIGVLGLLVSKSQGALIGTTLVVALALATSGGSPRLRGAGARSGIQRLNRALLAVACAGVVAVVAIQFLRPEAIPTSNEFRKSTVYHRIILGAGGLEIFSQHPLLGVGWRRSESPTVIASSDLAAKLRRRFSTPNEAFYPDVEITSVHNTYIQLLAELGLVGITLFGVALWAVGRRVLALLRNLQTGSGSWRQARFLTFGALLSLVWLNDNPLYGGQPETVLLAVALGSLVALARLGPSESADLTSAEAPQAVGTRYPLKLRVLGQAAKQPAPARVHHPAGGRIVAAGDRFQPRRSEADRKAQPSSRPGKAKLEAGLDEAFSRVVRELQLEIHSFGQELGEPSSATATHKAVEPSEVDATQLAEESRLGQKTNLSEHGAKHRRWLFRKRKNP